MLIDAPYIVTREMIASLKIDVVIKPEYEYAIHPHLLYTGPSRGSLGGADKIGASQLLTNGSIDPFAVPEEMGVLQTITIENAVSADEVIGRIVDEKERYEAKFAKKKVAEEKYYAERYKSSI